MKRKTILLFIILLLAGGASAKGGFGKFFKKIARGVATAATGAVVEQVIEHSGYKPEDAQQITKDLFTDLGVKNENIDKGLNYIADGDKLIRQNIVSGMVLDAAFDTAIESNENFAEALSIYKQMSDAQIKYLIDSRKATTQEEKKVAFDTRTEEYVEIGFNAYSLAKERKAQWLSDKLKIRNQLLQKGYDNEIALEVAGTILSIQRDTKLTEKEKQDYLKDLGFEQSPEEILEIAESISNTDDIVPTPIVSTSETITAKEENNYEMAKTEAIGTVNKTVIDGYLLDEATLDNNQKATLDSVAEVLNKYSELSLEIKGHTCSIGSESINNIVGLRRADNAKAYLVTKGIAANRISTLSGGEKEPVAENNTKENRKQNRRITFSITY